MQYFVKVAKKQHVTQAAEELHVAQSAVSRQINQLEQELGVTLFVQKGRNLQITPAGKMFLTRIESVMNDLERAVSEVQQFLDPTKGEVRIGFPHSLGIILLPTLIAKFREKYPEVKFRLKQGTYSHLIRDIVNGELDLSFISPLPDSSTYVEGELLMTEELYGILPKEHKLAGEESVPLKELKDESFVMFSDAYSLRTIVIAACKSAGFIPVIGFEGEETDTIRGLVAAGLGVSLIPEMALMETSQLQPVKLRITDPVVTRTIGLIRRKNEKLPPVSDVFRRFLLDYFKTESGSCYGASRFF